MTTPALQRLSERFPRARITLLTHEKLADLWLHLPSLDEVITFRSGEPPWSVARRIRAWHYANGFFELDPRRLPAAARHGGGGAARALNGTAARLLAWYARQGLWSPLLFDLAVIFPGSIRSALEMYLARIPRRVGYARSWRNWLLTEALPRRAGAVPMRKRPAPEVARLVGLPGGASPRAPADAHQIHDHLHVAAAVGASPEPVRPHLVVRPQEVEAIAGGFDLSRAAAGPHPVFGLISGAEYGPAKRWPADRFIAAARQIQARTRCTWLLLGGPGDAPIAGRIEAALRSPPAALRNLTGRTSLRELMGLLKLCRVLLTNDTGPMHVAAALDVPVVATFGSTSPELTGPGLPGDPRHRVLQAAAPCAPCFRRECPIDFRCMNGISVEQVVAAVERAAAGGP
jgi:heptosyltransferase II